MLASQLRDTSTTEFEVSMSMAEEIKVIYMQWNFNETVMLSFINVYYIIVNK